VHLTQKHVNNLLYATQGVGAVFVAIFLAAYIGGLPTTNVLHSLPEFRIPLQIFGAALCVLILATVILAAYLRSKPVSV
jgi:uncharacterized iron-regulated membrane protein